MFVQINRLRHKYTLPGSSSAPDLECGGTRYNPPAPSLLRLLLPRRMFCCFRCSLARLLFLVLVSLLLLALLWPTKSTATAASTAKLETSAQEKLKEMGGGSSSGGGGSGSSGGSGGSSGGSNGTGGGGGGGSGDKEEKEAPPMAVAPLPAPHTNVPKPSGKDTGAITPCRMFLTINARPLELRFLDYTICRNATYHDPVPAQNPLVAPNH